MIIKTGQLKIAACVLVLSGAFGPSAVADESAGPAADPFDGMAAVSAGQLAGIGNPSSGLQELPLALDAAVSVDADCASANSCSQQVTSITAIGQNVTIGSFNTTTTVSARIVQESHFGTGTMTTGNAAASASAGAR